jgi:putative membrane protein
VTLARLHPLTPVLRSARTLAVIIAGVSWQGYASLGVRRWTVLMLVVLLGALALSVVSWLVTGYQVVGRELRVSEGLLFRRHRTIPLERLQAVDVLRPVLARLTGLAELRLEVIGARRAEAPLSYLTLRQASELRDRLLALAAAPPAPVVASGASVAASGLPGVTPGLPDVPLGALDVASPSGAPAAPDERLLHAVQNRRLLYSQLLTGQVFALPLALAAVALQFLDRPVWTFVGVASLLTGMAGVLLRPARRIIDDWHFMVSMSSAGLVLRHGSLATRNQTVPLRRIQAVTVAWPLLWRVARWAQVRVDVAGYGAHDRRAESHVDRLLPVAGSDVVRQVVGELFDGLDVTGLPLVGVPRRARLVSPLRQPYLGIWLGDTVLATRDGWLTREVTVVPYARIQSVRVVQGPVRRALRLAEVHVDTAGAMRVVLSDRDTTEAYSLAWQIAARARTARSS